MFDKLCDNLNLLMSEARINASELARQTHLPASTIKKIRNRDHPNPTLSTLLPLAKYFSVSLSQLIGEEPLLQIRSQNQQTQAIMHCIPLLSWEEAILWPKHKNPTYPQVATEQQYSEHAYALTVEEDNWENLAKGTVLYVDPALKPEHRDFIIVYKQGQKLPSLKQALFDEGQMYLKPLVHGYHITTFTPEHQLLGIVMEYRKQTKQGSDYKMRSTQKQD